jgi:hypothetical protein
MGSKDLDQLIEGGDEGIKFLSPEGQRSIRAFRQYRKAAGTTKGDQLLKGAKRILPTLVDTPKRYFPEQQMA